MTPEEEQHRIEELRKSLYSKSNPPAPVVKRRRLHEIPQEVNDKWQPPKEQEIAPPPVYQGKSVLFKRLFIFAAIFFVLSLAVAGVVYFRGSNLISSSNINLGVVGPVSVAAGEVLSLDVDVTNRNNSPLELADLTFDYPDGTKSAINLNLPLKSDQLALNEIPSGSTIRGTSRSILYGEENTRQDIKITLTYRIPGSNAVFTKEANYNVLIASAPVSLAVDTLKEAIANQDINLKLHLVSNAVVDLKNLLVQVDYPFGFTYATSTPAPSFQNKIWSIPSLSPGESRDFSISGKINGQDGEERIFHIYAGTADSPDVGNISTLFLNNSQKITLATPFLSSQIALDGDANNVHVAASGKPVKGEIRFKNNLDTDVSDVVISLKLEGQMLDKTSVSTDKGFYRSIDNIIIWDKTQSPELATIPPGGSGSVQFSFNTFLPSFDIEKSYRQPTITISEDIQGRRVSENSVPETINSTLNRTVKIASNLSLTGNAVYSIGPFPNTGPLPPQAEQTTTYTINWAVTNSYNRVSAVNVVATLPPYMKWLGKISPSDEKVSFNDVNNQVTWQVGELQAGTGFVNSPKVVSFQVALTPSVSQLGSAPILINQGTIRAVDNFTGTSISSTAQNITTRLTTDPNFGRGQDIVQP